MIFINFGKFFTKKVIILLSLAIIVLAVGAIAWFSLTEDVIPAFMLVKSGEVMVDSGQGYKLVDGEVLLNKNWKVKTGIDGNASIVIYESLVHKLYPNTEISIDELLINKPKTNQKYGKTWTKFTGLSGMNTFEVETSSHVALVRGTGYTIENNSIKVIDGAVEVILLNGTKYLVNAGKVLEYNGGIWTNRDLTPEERAELLANLGESVDMLKLTREKLMQRSSNMLSVVKASAGITDEEIVTYIAASDRGELDVNEVYEQSSVKNEVVERFAELCKSIQEEYKLINSLSIG